MHVERSGQIYQDLAKFLAIKDGFTFGQKLTQIEKEAKKRFFDMSDEEIYLTLKSLIEVKQYYKDEILTNEEFEQWAKNATGQL
jgi:hypothetical protein